MPISQRFAPRDFDQIVKEARSRCRGPDPNALWYLALKPAKPHSTMSSCAGRWRLGHAYEQSRAVPFFNRAVPM